MSVDVLDLQELETEELESLVDAVLAARDGIDVRIQQRGKRYRKAVGPFSPCADAEGLVGFVVDVQGSQRRPYQVSIGVHRRRRQRVVDAVCSCPFSDGEDDCKHTWAALDRLTGHLDRELSARRPSSAQRPRRQPAGKRTRDWEGGLQHLDRFLSEAGLQPTPGSDAPEEPSVRVVWRVNTRGQRLQIDAYEQTRRKQGGYTPGRHLSWERLLRTEALWEQPDVLAVVLAFKHRTYELGMFWGLQRLDPSEILLELAGSPHVVWADQVKQPVTVIRGEVEARLAPREPDLLELALFFADRPLTHLPRRAGQGMVLVAEDRPTNSLTVGYLEPEVLELAQRFEASPPVFPPQAHPELFARLELLERAFPLRVPPALEGEPQDADPRLHLLLSPTDDGLAVEARVRPKPGGALLVPGAEGEVGGWVEGKRVRLRRDLGRERTLAREVLAELDLPLTAARLDDPRAWGWRVAGEAALDLVQALQGLDPARALSEWPEGARLSVSRPAQPEDLRVKVRDGRDWFGLEGELELDGERVPLADVLEALRQGTRYLPLAGGRWLQLSQALRERLGALGDVVQRSGKQLEVDATAGPVVEELLEGVGEVELCAGWEALRTRLARAQRVSTRPPRGLRAELRPYQLEGVAWLERLATWGVGACLADDMGLGKTVQAIALLLARAKEGPALVVAPTSVGLNWIRELTRFAPSLRALLYRDTDRAEVLAEFGPKDVVVISYDLARIDLERLAPVAWGTLVFDEAQQVKNATTKTARALRQLSGGWRLALTGTPVENHLGELWSLFRLISPGVFGGWEAFKRRFAEPIERDGDATRRAALARVIRPFVLRRTKAEVLRELPGRTDVQLDVELSPRELKLYEQTRLAAALELSTTGTKAKGDARFQILAALTKLRQLACHPRLVDASWEHGSAKLDAFLEVLDELRQGEHRALVFSQFTRHLALVREALEARGVSYLYLDGQTPARERQGLVDAFQAGEGEVFLISLKAGGKGLNLTAADYVVHLDPWWNPAVEDQATDRAHRLGQQKPVTVYRLVTQGTVEAQILALHAQKRDLVAGVLDGSDRAGKLSTDELIALIRGDEPAPARPVTRRAKRATSRSRSAPRPVADGPQALLALRQRHGLTQGQLGELLGVSAPTVCTWERGSRPLPAKRAAALRELSAASEAEVRRRLTPR